MIQISLKHNLLNFWKQYVYVLYKNLNINTTSSESERLFVYDFKRDVGGGGLRAGLGGALLANLRGYPQIRNFVHHSDHNAEKNENFDINGRYVYIKTVFIQDFWHQEVKIWPFWNNVGFNVFIDLTKSTFLILALPAVKNSFWR